MNILLVNVPIPNIHKIAYYCEGDAKVAEQRRVVVGPPLGLNMLAGMLPDENIVIMDQKAEADMDENYNAEEALIKQIKDMNADIVSFTCLTAQYNTVIRLLKVVKKLNPNILTTVGGIHVTAAPEDFIGSKADLLSIGLGKHSYYHLVKEYKANGKMSNFMNIPGLAINTGNKLIYTKSLTEYNYKDFKEYILLQDRKPNRALTDRYKYIIPRQNKSIHYISTSDGCTHKCNFCYLWKMTNGYYYHRSIDAIIDELKEMDKYDVIRFCDANTFGDMRKAKELFSRIIDEGLTNHMYMGDVRTDMVLRHPEILELAAKAGLKITVTGLEATTDEELKLYGKDNTVKNIQEALVILNELGIYVNGNYIIRPDYEEKNFEHIMRFVEDNPIYNSAYTILTPFPGTEQWTELQDQIVIRDYDYYNLTNCVLKTKLPERQFYENINQLHKASARATEKYFSKYGRPTFA